MTEQFSNDFDPSTLSEASRLRLIADGELPAEGVGDDGGARIDFESGLRERVAHVMGAGDEVRAPAELRASIEAMFAAERGDAPAVDGQPAVVTTPMGDTTDRSFWSGVRGFAAIAAVFALVATLIIVSTSNTFGPSGPTAPFSIQRVADIQTFVPKAHGFSTTCSPEDFAAKFNAESIAAAVDTASDHLEGLPADLRAKIEAFAERGYAFAGMGPCKVPGDGKSVHAFFTHASDESKQPVSVFIQSAPEMESNMCDQHCWTGECNDDSGETLAVWRCGGYLHYVYSPDSEAVALARGAFSAPGQTAALTRPAK